MAGWASSVVGSVVERVGRWRGGRNGRVSTRAVVAVGTGGARPGQGIVEFALASTMFLVIVLGTIDFGRAIFLAAELRNAVREGTAVGRLQPTNTTAIRTAVVNHGTGNGIPSSSVTVACTGGCTTGGTITVSASVGFQAVTQDLLGIAPFTMSASSTVDIE